MLAKPAGGRKPATGNPKVFRQIRILRGVRI
jgi:hypothetical protein